MAFQVAGRCVGDLSELAILVDICLTCVELSGLRAVAQLG